MRSESEILEYLGSVIEDVTLGSVPRERVIAETDLIGEIGLDSLDYASALLQCEQWLAVRIQEHGTDWRSMRTAGQLAAFLHDRQEQPER